MYDLFGLDARQARALARTSDPPTSKDAAVKMVKSGELNRQEKWVYDRIKFFIKKRELCNDPLDFTTKDIAGDMCTQYCPYHKAYDICKKRFSDLAAKGKIEVVQYKHHITEWTFVYKDKRRDGCRVWRLK